MPSTGNRPWGLAPGVVGALAITVAAALWGLDGVVLTPRLNALSVPFVVLLLHLVPFLLMQPLLWRSYGDLVRLPARVWPYLVLAAFAGGWLGTVAIVTALFLVDFQQLSVVVLLQKLQPVFAILLAALLLGERLTRRFLLLAGVALGGAYLMTFGARWPELGAGRSPAAAAAWAALAAAAFGSATVFGKRVLGALDFRAATFGRYGVTSALALGYLLLAGRELPFGRMTGTQWLLVLLIGLTTGSGAIFLYYFGLARVKA
ncbi:MAG: EamA family transporter, partial [Thermoanaerobaculia bacterium]|nr:EamA family transporter [Thermoanaerobaculia bacterium]